MQVVQQAVRSIMVLQHGIGVTGEIAVFHHSDCGMTKVTTDRMRELVKTANPGRDDVAATVDSMDFYHILDVEESVKSDLSGWVYDVETGKVGTETLEEFIYTEENAQISKVVEAAASG
ncbi:hypothetical protein B0H14DRAFT_3488134 [Mycena olivaceomarginata]|nr:hypothetical protein B0H14DRAFT_3488134 [Mycena olivaceomarginata]